MNPARTLPSVTLALLLALAPALAATADAGLRVLPLVVQRFYEPGETMEVKLVYYDGSGLVTGDPTVVQLTDPRGRVMDRRTVAPDGHLATYTFRLPEGTPPKYDDAWFGTWTMTAAMGTYTKAVPFEVRRAVGRRYERGLYEREEYYSGQDHSPDSAITIAPRSAVLPSGVDAVIPVSAVHGFGPYRGVMLVRVYTDLEKVREELAWVEDGTLAPKVNLPAGQYHVVVDIFPGERRRTQATTLSASPAVVLTPTPHRCGEFVAVVLDPVTLLPVEGAAVKVYGASRATGAAGAATFPAGTARGERTLVAYTLPDGRSGTYEVGTWPTCSTSGWTDVTFATDRPIYNPGQTVLFRGYTWRWTGERVVPVSQKVTIALRSSRGFTILQETATSNEHGIYSGRVTLPLNIDEETYWFSTDAGGGQPIEVRFFEKKQLLSEMALDHEREGYDHGDVVRGNVSLRYYFGKPAANSRVELSVWWAAREPGGGYGPVYYDEGPWMGEEDMYAPRAMKGMAYPGFAPSWREPELVRLRLHRRLNLTTGADGVASFEVALDELRGTHVVVDAKVTDPAGRTAELSKSARLAPEVSVEVSMAYYPSNETLHLAARTKGTAPSNLRTMSLNLTGVPPGGRPEAVTTLALDPTLGPKVERDFTIARSVALRYMYLEGELGLVDRYGRAWGAFAQAVTGKYELVLEPRVEGDRVTARLTLTDALTGEPVQDDSLQWSFSGPMAGHSVGIGVQAAFDGDEAIVVPVPHHPEGLYALSATATIGYDESTGYDRGLTLSAQRPVVLGAVRTARVWALTEELEPGDEARFVYRLDGFAPGTAVVEQTFLRDRPLATRVRTAGEGGNVTVAVPTSEDDAGGVGLAVSAFGTDGALYAVGGAARLKLKGLRATVTADRASYAPRDRLTLTVRVTDREGRPVPDAAVGLKVVDRAVIDASERGDAVSRPLQRSFSVTSSASIQSSVELRRTHGEPVSDPALLSSTSASPAHASFDRGAYMQRAKGGAMAGGAPPPMPMMAEARASAPMADSDMGMAKEEMSSKAVSLSAGEVAETLAAVQLRTLFPETFVWEPSALTGPDGTYTTTVTVPDSLTTWKAAAYASTLDARYAENETSFVTVKDFFLTPYLPASLTQGDNTTLRMTVHSYLEGELETIAGLREEEWFDLFTPNAASFTLRKDVPASVAWRLRARTPFMQNLTLFAKAASASGESHTDGVQQSIWVRPNGVPWEEAASGQTDDEEVELELTVPREAYGISLRGYARFGSEALAVYTSSARVDGYSYPTTEVTASRLIPSVLTREYRAKLGMAYDEPWFSEHVRALALELVFMRHEDGGWGWWKTGPSTADMTAYALRALAAAKRHVYVDDSLVQGAVGWLASHANEDGSYNGTQWLTGNDAGMTAYVLLSLAESGQPVPDGGMGYLHEALARGNVTDPYTLALYARLCALAGDPHGDRSAVTSYLLSLRKEDGPYARWSRGWSLGGPDETTALAALALLDLPAHRDVAKAGLRWLRERNPWEFTTTADQVASLAAHLRLLELEPPVVPNMDVELWVNGERAGSVHLEGVWGGSGELRFTDLLRPGKNTVRIVRRGRGKLSYDVWSTATLGGNVTASFEAGAPRSPGVYPVRVTLTPHADVAVPARLSVDLPAPDGVEVRPSRRLYVEELSGPRTFEVFYVASRPFDRLELGRAKAEYGLARGTKVGGRQFESWPMPALLGARPAPVGPTLVVEKSASYATAARDRVRVALSVANRGASPVSGELFDLVPAGLAAEGSGTLGPDGSLRWPLDLAPGASATFAYELSGEPGRYRLDAAMAFTDSGVASSRPVGSVVLRGEELVVLRAFDTMEPQPGRAVNVSISVTSAGHHGLVVVEEPLPPGFTLTDYAGEGGLVRKVEVRGDRIVWFLDHTSDVALWYSLAAESEGRVQAPPTRAYPQFSPELEGFSDEAVLSTGQGPSGDSLAPEPVVELPLAEGAAAAATGPGATSAPTARATARPLASATARPAAGLPEERAAREAYLRSALASIDRDLGGVADVDARSRISSLRDELEAAAKADDAARASALLAEVRRELDAASGVTATPPPPPLAGARSAAFAVVVAAALFAMLASRGRRGGSAGGSGGSAALVVACLGAALAVAVVAGPAPAQAMNRVDVADRELFVRPSLSVSVGAPEGERIDLTYAVDLSLVNRQERAVDAVSFTLDRPGLDLVPQGREDYTETVQPAPDGGSLVAVRFSEPVFIGEERSVRVVLNGKAALSDLEGTLELGLSTPEFFRSHDVQLVMANGVSLNRTSAAPSSEHVDEWNPDVAQWSGSCEHAEGEEPLNDGQCFSDAVALEATVRADPVTITDVAIADVLQRSLQRTRTWTVTYQNIGPEPVTRLPFDLGSRTTIATPGVSFSNGEAVLASPLRRGDTVTIEARERTSSLNYAQAVLETTPDELKRAIAPARRYRAHVEVHGLTVEWQDGLWGAEQKEEGGVTTYDLERTEPITYRIRVVT